MEIFDLLGRTIELATHLIISCGYMSFSIKLLKLKMKTYKKKIAATSIYFIRLAMYKVFLGEPFISYFNKKL